MSYTALQSIVSQSVAGTHPTHFQVETTKNNIHTGFWQVSKNLK